MHIVRANLDSYKAAKNKDHFWKQASEILQEQSHFGYSGPSCERRFKECLRLHKNEVSRRKRTGEKADDLNKGKETWYWNDAVHEITRNNPSIYPEVTKACGSSSTRSVKENSDSDPDDPAEPSSKLRIGKSRIPQLKRPRSIAEQKNDALLAVAAAMNRKNDILVNYMKSKEG